jgi:hypothetical protein
MKRWIYPSAVIIALLSLTGCSEEVVCPGDGSYFMRGTYIDESILVESSASIGPIESSWNPPGPYTCTFDLSGVPMFVHREFDDIEMNYTTPSSCTQDVAVYNEVRQRWDKIGFDDPMEVICMRVLTNRRSLFSGKCLVPAEYISNMNRMHVWSEHVIYYPSVRALRYNPDYYAFPTPFDPVNGRHIYNGITLDGTMLIACSAGTNNLYVIHRDGTIIDEISAPVDNVISVAHDGHNLWLITSGGLIVQTNPAGRIRCQFTTGIERAGGIGWSTGDLLLMDLDHPYRHVYRIDTSSSCRKGFMVCTDTVLVRSPGVGRYNYGVTGAGAYLFLVSDSLYTYNTFTGAVYANYLAVQNVEDIVWDGMMLWVLHGGPIGCGRGSGRGQYISRFKVRRY